MVSEKTCRRCNEAKASSEFRVDARYNDGMSSWCIECHRIRNSEWAKENRKRLTAKAADWRSENLIAARKANVKFKRANAEKLKAAHAEWLANNRDKRRQTDAMRKVAKRMATPAWADKKAIAAIYKECVELQKSTGQRIHVDHIVPIKSNWVCGLHCEANLQILSGPENEAKRNFWWPDMGAISGIEQAQRQGDMLRDMPPAEDPADARIADMFAGDAA